MLKAKYMLSTCYLLTSNHKKNLERNSKVTHLGPLAACRALVVDSSPTLPRSRRAWFIGGFLGFLSKKKLNLTSVSGLKCLDFCRIVSNSVSKNLYVESVN